MSLLVELAVSGLPDTLLIAVTFPEDHAKKTSVTTMISPAIAPQSLGLHHLDSIYHNIHYAKYEKRYGNRDCRGSYRSD